MTCCVADLLVPDVAHPSQQTQVGAALGVGEVTVAMVAVVVHLGLKRLALGTGLAPTATTSALPASKIDRPNVDSVHDRQVSPDQP